jgi:UDP-glucose 4-epimerase
MNAHLKIRKVLVTGGAGFIGSHLVRRLVREGFQVVVLDVLRFGNKLDPGTRRMVELIEGDVREEEVVLRAARNCRIIFHFAAVVGVEVVSACPVEAMETEAVGMRNVVRAARSLRRCKIIYASTSDVYGHSARRHAMSERDEVAPVSCYAVAKRFNELYLNSVFRESGIESVSLRFFNVYGPGQDRRMVIPRFFECAGRGRPMTVFGDGGQSRDFTYVDDAIEAVIRVARRAHGCEVVNIASGREYTVREVAEAIAALSRSRPKIAFARPSPDRSVFEVAWRRGSCRHLEKLVGFSPRTPLKEGLRRIQEALR